MSLQMFDLLLRKFSNTLVVQTVRNKRPKKQVYFDCKTSALKYWAIQPKPGRSLFKYHEFIWDSSKIKNNNLGGQSRSLTWVTDFSWTHWSSGLWSIAICSTSCRTLTATNVRYMIFSFMQNGVMELNYCTLKAPLRQAILLGGHIQIIKPLGNYFQPRKYWLKVDRPHFTKLLVKFAF